MLPQSPENSWREIQRQSFTSWKELALFLELSPTQCDRIVKDSSFPINVPCRLAEKMEKGSVDDPLFRQFVPLQGPTFFAKSPVQDETFCRTSKLLHKYPGRVLLLCSSACAMHCRFCFRQNFPYEKERNDFTEELQTIEKDPSLKELILSGGDPLSLGNRMLQALFDGIEKIPHIKRIRFHTRFPIGIPERIDEGFLSMCASSTKQIWFLIHCNHPKELDSGLFDALKKIQKLGIPVLSQTVLLKGINDSRETLQELFETLSDHGVKPYYLHQLDPVKGAESFQVSDEEGLGLMTFLQSRLSGYALPTFVKEIPGETSKTLITCD